MNTKPIPAVLSLLAGCLVCIISFVQHVDMVVFAQRFIIAAIVFFILGTVAKIVLDRNFKEEEPPSEDDEDEDEEDDDMDTDENQDNTGEI